MAQAPRLQLPTFKGEGDDTTAEATAFLLQLEDYFQETGTAEANKPGILSFCFKPPSSEAAEWWTNVKRAGDQPIATWAQCRELVRQRFCTQKTPAELMDMIDGLKQKDQEKVQRFRDRVNTGMLVLEQDFPEAIENLNQEQRNAAQRAYRQAISKHYFLNGLRRDLRNKVCAQRIDTYAEAVETALRVEKSEKDNKTQFYLNTIEKQTKELEKVKKDMELLQVQYSPYGGQRGAFPAYRGGRGGGRGGRGGGGYNQASGPGGGRGRGGGGAGGPRLSPSASGGSTARPTWLRNNMLPEHTCYKCGFQNHLAGECRTRPENNNWQRLIQQYNLKPGNAFSQNEISQEQYRPEIQYQSEQGSYQGSPSGAQGGPVQFRRDETPMYEANSYHHQPVADFR